MTIDVEKQDPQQESPHPKIKVNYCRLTVNSYSLTFHVPLACMVDLTARSNGSKDITVYYMNPTDMRQLASSIMETAVRISIETPQSKNSS